MSTVMKASDFATKAKNVAINYKTLYVLGCFGSPLCESHKDRYINKNSYNKGRKKLIQSASADTFGFDCVCFLKGLLWGWSGKTNATYGGAKYKANGVPDVGADSMFSSYCTSQSTNFKNIEVGEFVWMKGHIGVYIGNGLAVECTPIWKDGVQVTAVGNIGKKSGYNTRTWTKHGKSKFLDYSTTKATVEYYPKCNYKGTSIVSGLNSIKVDSSYSHREKIAKANGISGYKGSASQNTKMLNLLKQGKLKKA